MVLDAFASIAGLLNKGIHSTKIDNFVFRLHYRWTTGFCFIACALVATSGLIGARIQCTADSTATTYCWIASTYSINTTVSSRLSNREGVYGIGGYNPKIHEKRFHSYYQWVPFILFVQGCFFYLPHLLWKSKEGKLAEKLLQGLHLTPFDEEWALKTKHMAKYLATKSGYHKRYYQAYVFCECLNFINLFAQMLLIDLFFGGIFLTLGTEVFALSSEEETLRSDILIQRFPRVAKCDFKFFGSSGTLQTKDILCILPQNLLNEKIYIIMWIWFSALIIITGLQLFCRFLLTLLPMLRIKLLEQRGRLQSSIELDSLLRKMGQGDFLVLRILSKNLKNRYFKYLLGILLDHGHNVGEHPSLEPAKNNPKIENEPSDSPYRTQSPYANIMKSHNLPEEEEFIELK